MLLFTLQYTVLTLQYSLEYSIADLGWPTFCWPTFGWPNFCWPTSGWPTLVGLPKTVIFDHP